MFKKLMFSALMAAVLTLPGKAAVKEPVDYVNPYIGNVSHLLVPTFATVQLPNSMLRVYPERADFTSEYINGLPIIVTNHREKSAFKLSVSTDPIESSVVPVNYDNEHLTPYSFDVLMNDGEIYAEYALSHQSAIYQLKADKPVNIALSSLDGKVELEGNAIKGYQTVTDQTKVYVYMETSCAPSKAEVKSFGSHKTAVLSFNEAEVGIRYGVSFISTEQAKENLRREISDYDIAALAAKGRKIWNDTLGRIDVSGGTEDQKTVFYTSYYRTFERPVCMSEGGRYWSAFDNSVHEDGGVPFYTDDWIWDTYRAAHPLRIIMDREVEEDILTSFLRMAEQMGNMWMPTFPETNGDSRRMNSNHTVATFADAIVKGLDVDIPKAFEASKKALTEKTLAPWCGNKAGWIDEFFWTKGYIPALKEGERENDRNVHEFEKRQPVAVTLGTSYDCWCLSTIANAAGQTEDAGYFLDKSFNYRNLFNDETLFFHPKDKNGKFIKNLDYSFCGGMGAREYYGENNGWVYRWDVQHNIPDLIKLMGGPERFCAELDGMFAEDLGRSKFEFYAMLPDHTGNVGQFSMANEPSLHIPYLYNYAGAPWKTQKRIRQMLETWFRNDLMGVPGDEDGGGMTSFVVFSSIGFYPVTPGSDVYTIGSPLFDRTVMKLTNGNVFEIIANNVSKDNKYIKSAKLNGKALDTPFISHSDLMNGGTLILEMSDRPDKEWGRQ
ncbi:MAG: GH92 family glycosyl hydrolase [Bacteroidales bacterium]|nr:GH92 family glycosyl hydrolase [Bacteroidales bacterium]